MITKKVNRYYCEHCRKGGQSAGCIRRHEAGCTANTDRVCGMCAHARLQQKPLAELIPHVADGEWGIKELSNAVEGCPACILAAIRQSGINKNCSPEEYLWYDFKTAMTEWFQQQREDESAQHDAIYF